MKLTVYSISGAPRGWRVLLGLAFKGLDYNVKYLQGSQGEHKSPAFRAINPRATIPVLDAGGLIIRDSIGILAWLDRQYPEKPLFGATPEAAASIWQTTTECCDYLRAAINDLFFPILVQGELLPEMGTERRAVFDEAANTLHAECRFLEDILGNSTFFGGEAPSAADAIIFPEIRLIQRAAETKPDIIEVLGFNDMLGNYPQLTAWRDRVEALPGVDKTMPPHWSK